ncbi:hypothetical protein [Peribacillus frigoritolerans]|uniref:Uncharacterized protein n=1 Tax=Peribacillus castrilensis TaxID=2897690 RepID=A0AAW9NLD9_9BACI|nr:hypothetical protein [Peribacillus castrilensis]
MFTHVKCLKRVEDGEGVYCFEKQFYEIIDHNSEEDLYTIECDIPELELQILGDDPAFEFMRVGV